MIVKAEYFDIYNDLKKLPIDAIKNQIDGYFKSHGLQFVEALVMYAILDIDSVNYNPIPNVSVTYIEKYSERLILMEVRRNNLSKIINTWQIWLVAIGTIGLFLLELLKFLLTLTCK